MKKVEVLEAEIKEKISFIRTHFLKIRKNGDDIGQNIPKYLDSISKLEKENDKLKVSYNELVKQHNEDLKEIDNLVEELSNLLERTNA